MGSMPSQRFSEFRYDLPILCQCGEVFVDMDKLNHQIEENFISYTTKDGDKVSFSIRNKKYKKRILYVCSGCGHAIWVGDYDGGGSIKLGKATF